MDPSGPVLVNSLKATMAGRFVISPLLERRVTYIQNPVTPPRNSNTGLPNSAPSPTPPVRSSQGMQRASVNTVSQSGQALHTQQGSSSASCRGQGSDSALQLGQSSSQSDWPGKSYSSAADREGKCSWGVRSLDEETHIHELVPWLQREGTRCSREYNNVDPREPI